MKEFILRLLAPALATIAAPTVFAAAGAQEAPGFGVPPHIDGKLAYHHHPVLRFVLYDGVAKSGGLPEIVGLVVPPANLGIERVAGKRKLRETHVHEGISGRIHTESVDPVRKYRLGDFIALWAKADPTIAKTVARAKRLGSVYLFDHNRTRGTFYTTRLADANSLLDLTLDDGRHIVVYLPKDADEAR